MSRNLAQAVLFIFYFIICFSHASSESHINIVGTDHDGWAEADVKLYKESVWDESGLEKREYKLYASSWNSRWKEKFSGSLKSGTKTFKVPPGKYKVAVYYSETSGFDTPKYSEGILIGSDENVTIEFYFERSIINVIGTDHDGWADADVKLYREHVWNEGGLEKKDCKLYASSWNSRWKDMFSGSLKSGTKTFSVPPGKYKVSVYYSETSGFDSPMISDIFEVCDVDTLKKEFYFEKGLINVIGTDYDGWAEADVKLFRENVWEEGELEKRDFRLYASSWNSRWKEKMSGSLRSSTKTFKVPPGRYKVSVYYSETSGFDNPKGCDLFEVGDNEIITKKFYFEKNSINIIGTDYDGWADADVKLFKENIWEEGGLEKRDFRLYASSWNSRRKEKMSGSLRDGSITFDVPSGKYKLALYHSNKDKYNSHLETETSVNDRQIISKYMDFVDGSISEENIYIEIVNDVYSSDYSFPPEYINEMNKLNTLYLEKLGEWGASAVAGEILSYIGKLAIEYVSKGRIAFNPYLSIITTTISIWELNQKAKKLSTAFLWIYLNIEREYNWPQFKILLNNDDKSLKNIIEISDELNVIFNKINSYSKEHPTLFTLKSIIHMGPLKEIPSIKDILSKIDDVLKDHGKSITDFNMVNQRIRNIITDED